MEKQKIFSILNRETIEHIKKNKFNGKLTMKWRDGLVVFFNLNSNLKMSIHNKEDFDPCFFDPEDDDL